MNKLENAIRGFHRRVSEFDRVSEILCSVFRMPPECKLNAVVWDLIDGYMDAIDEIFFLDRDIKSWLQWWWLECDLGKNPL